MKTCRYCKIPKPKSEYWKNSARYDGLQTECKECRRLHDTGALNRRFSSYKRKPKLRGRDFDISIEQFDGLTSQPCYYCDGYSGYYRDKGYNGLDRVDNKNNLYTVNNVVPCCTKCNFMKRSMDKKDFIGQAIKIALKWSKLDSRSEINGEETLDCAGQNAGLDQTE